jgi:hypothetical protein
MSTAVSFLAAALALVAIAQEVLPLPSPSGSPSCRHCPNEFDPTCCEFPDSTRRTMGSPCACSCYNGTSLTFGERCPGDNRDCLALTKPVCCRTADSNIETVNNGCACEDGGGAILSKAACPKKDVCKSVSCRDSSLTCDDIGRAPVCLPIACDCFDGVGTPSVCCESRGARFTAGSRCSCEFCGIGTGGAVLFEGDCPARAPCSAGPEVDPVCCERANGSLFQAVNPDACACEEGTVLAKGLCTEDGPQCFPMKCQGKEVCIIQGGEATCVLPGNSCATLVCSNGESCSEGKDGPACVPVTSGPVTSGPSTAVPVNTGCGEYST